MTISIKKTGHRSFNPVLKIWLKNGGHTGQSSLHTGSLQTPAVGSGSERRCVVAAGSAAV